MVGIDHLLKEAEVAKTNSHTSNSSPAVGAALETTTGDVFRGCSIENRSQIPTIHAVQAAVINAISNGQTDFEKLALVTRNKNGEPPCGHCREFLKEFVDDHFSIYSADEQRYRESQLGPLLPSSAGEKSIYR